MNLPNFLTILRLFLTVVFIFLIYRDSFASILMATLVFAVAAISDFLDGYIARKYNLSTTFGKIMDPIADKFLMLSAFLIFADMGLVLGWMVWLIIIREVAVTVSRLWAMKKGIVLAAEKAGKLKTVIQIATAFLVLAFMIIERSDLGDSWLAGSERLWLLAMNLSMLVVMGVTLYSGITYYLHNKEAFRK